MRPEDRDPAYLWDIRRAARETLQLVAGLDFSEFTDSRVIRLAVERELGIIGEAARRVSPTFRDAHPEVPWRRMIGLRNIIVHEYYDVDLAVIWDVLKQGLPELIPQLDTLIPPIPGEGN